MKGFKRYLVKRKDNLETIAENLNIKVEELRHFHNYNCDLANLIGGNKIPGHVKEILYPSDETINNTIFHPSKIIDSSESFLFEQRYTSQLLSFECAITILSENNELNYKNNYSLQYFHKSKKYFYVEIKFEPSLSTKLDLLSELKEKIYTIHFPLMLVINNDGSIHDIHNFSRIKNRWLKLKKEINSHSFVPSISDFLNQNDTAHLSKDQLIKQLKNDWFLTSYFFGIYTSYDEKWETNKTIDFPLVDELSPISFHIKQKILNYPENQNFIISNIESYNKSENIDISKKDKYKAQFTLDPMHRIPNRIKVDCSLGNRLTKNISISITRLTNS